MKNLVNEKYLGIGVKVTQPITSEDKKNVGITVCKFDIEETLRANLMAEGSEIETIDDVIKTELTNLLSNYLKTVPTDLTIEITESEGSYLVSIEYI